MEIFIDMWSNRTDRRKNFALEKCNCGIKRRWTTADRSSVSSIKIWSLTVKCFHWHSKRRSLLHNQPRWSFISTTTTSRNDIWKRRFFVFSFLSCYGKRIMRQNISDRLTTIRYDKNQRSRSIPDMLIDQYFLGVEVCNPVSLYIHWCSERLFLAPEGSFDWNVFIHPWKWRFHVCNHRLAASMILAFNNFCRFALLRLPHINPTTCSTEIFVTFFSPTDSSCVCANVSLPRRDASSPYPDHFLFHALNKAGSPVTWDFLHFKLSTVGMIDYSIIVRAAYLLPNFLRSESMKNHHPDVAQRLLSQCNPKVMWRCLFYSSVYALKCPRGYQKIQVKNIYN